MVPANVLPSTTVVASIAGTWHWRDGKMLIELSAEGLWRLWNLEEQSGRPSEPPFMSGKWFVHDQALYLRIEHHAEGGVHAFQPGMAIVFDINSVTPEVLHLNLLGTEKEVTWRLVAEPAGPANGSQPIRSGTNSTSTAAGSCR